MDNAASAGAPAIIITGPAHDIKTMSTGRNISFAISLTMYIAAISGCMKWEYDLDSCFDTVPEAGKGLFICNEGNFQYGNASLSYYDTESRTAENDVFIRANDQKLGDVAHSMTLHDGTLWIVVNNSHVIFAIDPVTFKEKRRITGFTSPRYIHFISDKKAYVTQLWDNRIFIVDPSTCRINGYIDTGMEPGTGSTEQMVRFGEYVITNCWSYQNRILKIDIRTDEVVQELEVGIQPSSMALDAFGKLWVLTDGGYEGSPAGHEAPTLCRIDPEEFTVEKRFRFSASSEVSSIVTNAARDTLYFLDNGVWKMPADAAVLPAEPFISMGGTNCHALAVNPYSSDIYVADAIDFQQKGIIYRYSPSGELTDEFRAGITPGSFCWY